MPAATLGTFLVFLLILVALGLFVTEPVPIDVTAIGIMVTLMILGPWTGVPPCEGVSGFSNPATITILAMMILSEGVHRTGAIQRLEQTVASFTGESESRKGALSSRIGTEHRSHVPIWNSNPVSITSSVWNQMSSTRF
jgi:di/tricarboxylate transporter